MGICKKNKDGTNTDSSFDSAGDWAAPDGGPRKVGGFNYALKCKSAKSYNDSNIITFNPIQYKNSKISSTPYWGDINFDNIKYDNTLKNNCNNCNSNNIYIGDGSDENNSRIYFLKKFKTFE